MNNDASGELRTAKIGQPVTIELEATPGTGAVWYLAHIPPRSRVHDAPSRAVAEGVGGPVHQVFIFEAEVAGTYELRFELKRAWENVVRRHCQITIRVA